MHQASEKFVSNLDTAPLVVRLTFADGRIIPEDSVQHSEDPIISVSFTGGSSSGSTATIGCAVSAGAEIVLDRSLLVSSEFGDQQLHIDVGMELDGTFEWVPMGAYRITKLAKTDDTVTLWCADDIGTLLERPYEPLAGFDFEAGVDAKSFVSGLCARRGVPVDLSGLQDVTLQFAEPIGLTERQIVAAVAGLCGKFACMDRTGTLRFLWYSSVDAPISPDNYYDGECVSGDTFVAAYIKCYNSTLAETLVAGDGDQAQGLYFECPWCSQEHLETLWIQQQGFRYTAIESVRLLGNPLLDPWDIVTLTDLEGKSFPVPIMSISHEYDGGMITEISAPAQANAEIQEGPVQREFKRTATSIIKKLNEIDIAIRGFDGKEIISRINLTEEEIHILAKHLRLEGLTTINGGFKIDQRGSMEAVSGRIGGTNIGANMLYSGQKDSKDSPEAGYYLGSAGDLVVGDGEQYIRYTLDPNGVRRLSMLLSDLRIAGRGSVAEGLDEAQRAANSASTAAGKAQTTADNALNKTNANATDLADYKDEVLNSLTDLQKQIDGNITTYFYSYAPTTSNVPASQWTTTEEKDKHLGDLFYITGNAEKNGQAYRWAKSGNAYLWELLSDADITKALAMASNAQDTADGKRRVFVSQPKPPYDEGDLWAQGDGGYLMKCHVPRVSGSFLASDWVKAASSVNDLEIGGRNLIKDSAEVLADRTDTSASYLTEKLPVFRNTDFGFTQMQQGGEFVLSLDYEINGITTACDCYFALRAANAYENIGGDRIKLVVGDNTGHFSTVFTPSAAQMANGNRWAMFGFGNNQNGNVSIKLKNIRLEKGNRPSGSWSPAPEDLEAYADSAAQTAVNAQTSEDVLKRLTDNYTIQGFYIENEKFYFNAQAGKIVNFYADDIVAGTLKSTDGSTTKFDLSTGQLYTKNAFFEGGKIGGWNIDENSLYSGSTFASSTVFLCSAATGSKTSLTIGNYTGKGWMLKAGKFGVLYTGAVYGEDCDMTGKFISYDESKNRMELSAAQLAFYKNGATQQRIYLGYNPTFDVASVTVRGTSGYTASFESREFPMFDAPDEDSGYEENVSRVLVWKKVYGNWCLVGIDAAQMPASLVL